MDKFVSSSAHGRERLQKMHQKFRFYDISWHVDNFYIQSCEENWELCTPEFDGPQKSKLKLILKLIQSKSISNFDLSFIVKRPDSDAGPQTVWINFSMHISGKYINPRYIVINRLCSLNKGTENESNFVGTDNLFNKIDEPDSLNIYSRMVIYVEDEYVGFDECSDVGLRSLSDDMLAVFERNQNYDIELKFGSFVIPAHKSVLFARCEVMDRSFKVEVKKQKSLKVETLDLSEYRGISFDIEAMKKIVAFLYTGNLKPLFQKPSLSMYHLALAFNIQEIKEYYAEESLVFLSSVDTYEFLILWRIHSFGSVCENNEHLLTPIVTEGDSNRTWRFHLYFRNHENGQYASILAETNEIASMTVCLEISVVNDEGNASAVKILRKHIDSCSMFGFEEFAHKNWIKSAAIHDTLTLGIQLKLSAGRQSSAVKQQFFFTHSHAGLRSYEKLSKDIRSLHENGAFSDDLLPDRDGRCFCIHKDIVRIRCSVLYDILTQKEGLTRSPLRNTDPDVVRTILIYIYSGSVEVEKEDNLLKILKFANELNLPILATACKKLVLELLNKEDN